MVRLELTEEELNIIYNCVNGQCKHWSKMNCEKMQSPELAVAHREKLFELRNKIRPLKTKIWREEQRKKHESSR